MEAFQFWEFRYGIEFLRIESILREKQKIEISDIHIFIKSKERIFLVSLLRERLIVAQN